MALIHISYVVRDADGDKNSMSLCVVRGAHTLANTTTFAQNVATLLDAITDGAIEEINLLFGCELPGGLKADPVAGAEAQIGGLIAFGMDGSDYRYAVRVPAFHLAYFTMKTINLAQAEVEAFTDEMVDGETIGGELFEPCNKFEFDLDSVIEGTKSIRRK